MDDIAVRAAYKAHAETSAIPLMAQLGDYVAISAHSATILTSSEQHVIDLASGGLGFQHPYVRARVAEQVSKLPLSTRMFFSQPLAMLVKRIASLTPPDLNVSYIGNTESEAVEGALKLVRGYHRDRQLIVSTIGAYHGSTLGALSICGVEELRQPFRYLPLKTIFVPYGDLDAMRQVIDKRTAAVVIAPIATGIGVRLPPSDYLRAVRALCTASGTLLVVNETITGLGITGRRFGVDYEQVIPDIMILGGVLGGGILSTGVYVTKRNINNRVYGKRHPALHGSTTGGSPIACAAALAALDVLEREQLAAKAAEDEMTIIKEFKAFTDLFGRQILSYSVRGLIAGLELHNEQVGRSVQHEALANGVLVRLSFNRDRAWIELRPPLTITALELRGGLKALEASLRRVLDGAYQKG